MTPRPSTGVRDRIVVAAQQTFHEQGYHGSSLDEILARAKAAKGGLYHHFPDKRALGTAVVEERLAGLVEARWGSTDWHDDPISFLSTALSGMQEPHLLRGCPVNSFAQEVSFHDEPLRTALATLFDRWIELIAMGLQGGIDAGTVCTDVDPLRAATYYLAVWEGVVALSKANRRGREFVEFAIAPLADWLETLRPA